MRRRIEIEARRLYFDKLYLLQFDVKDSLGMDHGVGGRDCSRRMAGPECSLCRDAPLRHGAPYAAWRA